jgi:adenylate kinase
MSATYSSLNLVLLGPPGSGKSTQAVRLSDSYHVPHISTHDMLRDEVERATAVGIEADAGFRRGELVNDRLLAGLVLQRLDRDDCARGFILDGYPRTRNQAELLDGILAELGRSIERVVLIDVPFQTGIARLTADSTPEGVARERLRVWQDNAASLVEYYGQRGLLLEVNGDRPVAEVSGSVLRAVGAPVGA